VLADELAQHGELGDGLVHRVASTAQRRFITAPAGSVVNGPRVFAKIR
jgi:hypothetical protein